MTSVKPKRRKRGSGVAGAIFTFGVTLFVIYLLLVRVFSVNRVVDISMGPTIHENDIVIGIRHYYNVHEPHRGDVVIYPHDNVFVIKRIVGVEGDKLSIRDGRIFINGKLLQESYLKDGTVTDGDADFVVPDGMLFLMGDNRDVSYDSRYYADPYVDKDNVVGRVCYLFHGFHFEVLPRYTDSK